MLFRVGRSILNFDDISTANIETDRAGTPERIVITMRTGRPLYLDMTNRPDHPLYWFWYSPEAHPARVLAMRPTGVVFDIDAAKRDFDAGVYPKFAEVRHRDPTLTSGD